MFKSSISEKIHKKNFFIYPPEHYFDKETESYGYNLSHLFDKWDIWSIRMLILDNYVWDITSFNCEEQYIGLMNNFTNYINKCNIDKKYFYNCFSKKLDFNIIQIMLTNPEKRPSLENILNLFS